MLNIYILSIQTESHLEEGLFWIYSSSRRQLQKNRCCSFFLWPLSIGRLVIWRCGILFLCVVADNSTTAGFLHRLRTQNLLRYYNYCVRVLAKRSYISWQAARPYVRAANWNAPTAHIDCLVPLRRPHLRDHTCATHSLSLSFSLLYVVVAVAAGVVGHPLLCTRFNGGICRLTDESRAIPPMN